MTELTPGLWQLAGFPPQAINIYLAGDVLIDCGTRWARWRVLRQLAGRTLRLVALTHCHPDHQGTARVVCERFRVPLACHEADVAVMEGRAPMAPQTPLVRFADRVWSGPAYPVGRVLRDGDEVAGFRVIHAPGHTVGHVIFFRESDRVAVAGDVLANIHFLTGRVGLRLPPAKLSVDPAQNVRSARQFAALRPSLVCFGHGPPLRDPGRLQQFIEKFS
jgi:glyoxylase-like metal-dependent hydrolase (beta-lactamase superfamily II)